jgi:two-component system LytT family sensor kinase
MQNTWPVKYKTVVQHVLLWLGYMLFQAVSYGWENTDEFAFKLAPQIFIVALPVIIILTYFNLYVLMPAYYYRQKFIAYAMAMVLALLAGAILERYITYRFVVPWERLHDPIRYRLENLNFWIPVRILRLAIEAIPVLAVTMLVKLMQNAYTQQKRLRNLEKEKFNAEMGFLRAQINPHFFFNTLNSLYGLILQKSALASKLVLRLSELMHYMLYETAAEKVLLKNELNHLENYIGIEQMRFADRLDISFQYSGDIAGKMITPLLLLPFIENTFKHGAEDGKAWITIDLKVIETTLFFKVENSFTTGNKKSEKGIGLANVKKRLDLTHAANYQLDVNQQDKIYSVNLKLQL